jgi:hypothetical protein
VADDENKEPLPDESFASLTIYSGTSSAQELADALGVTPDESWDKGERNKRGRIYPSSAISLRSGLADAASPGAHLGDLLTRIAPLQSALTIQAEAGNKARLKLAFFADTDNPMFTLSADVLRKLGDFGLDLEVDIYEV